MFGLIGGLLSGGGGGLLKGLIGKGMEVAQGAIQKGIEGKGKGGDAKGADAAQAQGAQGAQGAQDANGAGKKDPMARLAQRLEQATGPEQIDDIVRRVLDKLQKKGKLDPETAKAIQRMAENKKQALQAAQGGAAAGGVGAPAALGGGA